jgi:hypothetical protein
MNALPDKQLKIELTETEAYEFIKHNWKHGKIQQASNYTLKDIEELRRIGNLGRVLNIPHPDWKENELYKLVTNKWEHFSKLGAIKDFTPLLSYRSVAHILMLYDFELKVDYSKLSKVSIKKTTNFKYTENEACTILEANKSKLQDSISKDYSIDDLTSTQVLIKLLKTNQTALYRLMRDNVAELELLGCSKTNRWNLSYRGVLFLLLEYNYPLTLKIEQPKVVNIITKQPMIEPQVKQQYSKPDITLIKDFLEKRSQELKIKAEKDKKKANISSLNLQIVEDAYWHIKTAEELLQEIGL